MDENKIKFALNGLLDAQSSMRTSREFVAFVEVILDADEFNCRDIMHWWDVDRSWWQNKRIAEKLMRILSCEHCIIVCRVCRTGDIYYKKTDEFRALLRRALRVEEILSSLND